VRKGGEVPQRVAIRVQRGSVFFRSIELKHQAVDVRRANVLDFVIELGAPFVVASLVVLVPGRVVPPSVMLNARRERVSNIENKSQNKYKLRKLSEKTIPQMWFRMRMHRQDLTRN
jgi:hypothetical protein